MRALLLDNLPLKVVALILAVTLVIVKHEEAIATITVAVPVRVEHPMSRVLVSPAPEKVLVVVEGRYGDLDELQIPPLDVRLTGFEGDAFNFERELFKVPPGMRVSDVRPPAMLLRFEEKVLQNRHVKADLQGMPEEGYRLAGVELSPPEIAVEGAKSTVERLEEVLTERIDLTGRNQSTTLEVGLTRPPENVAYLHGNEVFRVQVVIEEKIETRTLEGITIGVQGEPPGSPGYEVSPPTADITVRGPVSQLAHLDPAALEVFVNVAGANANRRILKSRVVDAVGPPSLTVLEVRPSKVTLVQKDPPPEPEPPAPPLLPPDAGVP